MKIQCNNCNGSGIDPNNEGDDCPKCKGKGSIDKDDQAKRPQAPPDAETDGPESQFALKKEGRRDRDDRRK